jgi:hypothetical protein
MRFSKGEKHLEELAAQRECVHRQLARSDQQNIDADADADAIPQTVWGESFSNPPFVSPIIRKARTRSSSSPAQGIESPSPATETPVSPEPQPSPTKIFLRRDNIAIIKAMFPKNGEDSSRSFAWQHFLSAMTDAGFSILQSQGSAVTLKLEKIKGVNTIVVHRPHPVATISK